MTELQKTKPLLIIDGYGFIFRAYHVQPPLHSPTGIPVGAIYGFITMLLKLINDFKPEHAVIVLDHSRKNFRHDLYTKYKANRPPSPDDLVVQLKLVEKAANSLNFTCLSKQGFEADDIIATLATKATQNQREVVVISSDKDLMQLVSDHVKMYDPVKSKYITTDDILAKFGVEPLKVREVQALIGDASDNIPGVAGIGPKTASLLINQFGDLKGVFNSLEQVKNARQRELLSKYKEDALISWQLVGLDHAVDINEDLESLRWSAPKTDKISAFLNEYGFKSLNRRIENLFNVNIPPAKGVKTSVTVSKKQSSVMEVQKIEQLDSLLSVVKKTGQVAVSIHQDGQMTKISLSYGGNSYLVPYEKQMVGDADLFSYNNSATLNMSFNKKLHEIFEDRSIKKVTYNLKKLLRLCDCTMRSFDDIQIMEYVLSAGKKQIGHEDVVDFLDLYAQLHNQLFQDKALHLYEDIDLPLCHILYKMEQEGVKIDIHKLQKLSAEFTIRISDIEKKIFTIAGEEFNIASPKQLGAILFDKMKLPFAKTTSKTKSYSTNASILEKLQEEGHEIASLLFEYRHLTKLKSTYTDVLPKQVNARTGRIHTTFLQTVTSTSRLSSVEPNVQNIPTRSEEGNNIRAAFVAKPGTKLISVDYSQIELRILSHIANIGPLKQAFANDVDVHTQTASQVFSLPIDQVTQDIRRKAKAINFGIIYGISAFGLASQLNIPRHEAADYIDKYFKEYPGIQQYMSKTIEFAKENNFVKSIVGRKCFLPTINDTNHALRSLGERAAINAPMQSLASDIVKMAMIILDKELKEKSMHTKMILQIHDELIFEAPDNEIENVSKLIKSVMENAIKLDVPTIVTINVSDNWQKI